MKEIKIGDTTFEFKMPEMLDTSVLDMMKSWVKLIEDQKKPKEDVWYEIEGIPYKFKNLALSQSPIDASESNEITFTLKYEEKEKL